MKNKVKKIFKPAYKLFIKSNMGRKIRQSVKPAYKVYIKNNKIIGEVDAQPNFKYVLTADKKNYPFNKGKVKFPLTDDNIKLFQSNEYELRTTGYHQTATFTAEELNAELKDEFIKIGDLVYSITKTNYILVQLSRNDNNLQLNLTIYNSSAPSPDSLNLLVVDKSYNLLLSTPVDNNIAIIKDIDDLLSSTKEIQLIFVSGEKAFMPVPKYFRDNSIAIRNNYSRLYLKQEIKTFSYIAKGLDNKIPDLKSKYEYIDSISYESRENALIINFKNTYEKCRNFALYLKSLKTNERELLQNITVQNQIVLNNIDHILDREINLIDRYVLEFEITDENGKILENNWMKIICPKTRHVENYILHAAHGNQLSFLDRHILIVENSQNHFTYEEKYDFDLENHTFSTDCSVFSDENGNVKLALKIYSLLSKIKSYTIYLTDNYAKKTYCFYEHILPESVRFIDDTILIDMDKLNSYMYYNARLNFRIGVEYVGGYCECGFLTKKRAQYSTVEKYLYKFECDEDMVTSFYLGGNQYNLNAWHTSEDEYEKGVRFQIGREKYFETLKNEDSDENLIMFEANLGKNYTGNPKYLYEYMLRTPEYSDFKFVWAYPDTESTKIPGNPILAERGSSEYFYYLAKARYWVNNIRFPVNEKRDSTVYLQTWHGTPLKKLGFDIQCEGPEKQAFGGLYKESQNWDYLLVDNDYGEEKLVNAFRFKKKVIKAGYPINDIFYNNTLKSSAQERLFAQYPAISNKKVILYAPTWRDLQGDYVRGYDFSLPFDLEELYENFSDEYVILVKLHHLIADNLVVDEKYKDFLINASNEEDVMELLCITDILITDYSSVFYDFASAKKPILFYAYDLDEYINETRGLYVGMDTLPGPILKDSNDLVEAIANINDYEYSNSTKLQDFCNEMAKYCNGSSCKKVLDIVLEDKKSKK
ncbi:MAG: CDP-glycerol glycerophosphotransferase family protein [Eubacterium sp.]